MFGVWLLISIATSVRESLSLKDWNKIKNRVSWLKKSY